MCFEGYFFYKKQLSDKNLPVLLGGKYKHHVISVLSKSIEHSIQDGLSKISNFQATINALISRINLSTYNILLFLRTYFPYVSSILN